MLPLLTLQRRSLFPELSPESLRQLQRVAGETYVESLITSHADYLSDFILIVSRPRRAVL